METTADHDPDLETQLILLAASHHDLEALRPLLKGGSASVQDPETGFTPLHAAIAACELDATSSPITATGDKQSSDANGDQNGDQNGQNSDSFGLIETNLDQAGEVEAAAKTMRLLLQNGAIWNDLDKQNETPACMARRLGLTQLYDIMVDAGVRAEILLNRLSEYTQLEDVSEDDERLEEDPVSVMDEEPKPDEAAQGTDAPVSIDGRQEGYVTQRKESFLLDNDMPDVNSENYLASDLTFKEGRLLDGDNNGVMMAWETEIMQRTADLLLPITGLRVLNIGHGMGLVDGFFQDKQPVAHHIIEAHPKVLAQMRKAGWYEKIGVTVHEGKWQDVVPKLLEDCVLFDAVYFDTFAEDYKALKTLFDDYLIGIVEDSGRWGFFHGLGADRQVCYDVYTKVVEMDLFEAGYEVKWDIIKVPDLDKSGTWNGVRRRYWTLDEYKLPICTFFA